MGIEKEREAFEAWCHVDDQFCTHRYAGSEDYSDDYAQCAWLAWQAAKAQAVPESNALLSDAMDAVQKLGSGDFVLVSKEPSTELVNHGHDVFLGHFNEGGQTGGRSLYFAYKAMIEAQEQSHD